MLLIAPFVPHHHHEGVACAALELCEQDNTYNDEHTGHATDNEGNFLCVENATFIVSKSESTSYLLNTCLQPIIISTFFDVYREIKKSESKYVETYKPVDFNLSNGLRAPPYSLI